MFKIEILSILIFISFISCSESTTDNSLPEVMQEKLEINPLLEVEPYSSSDYINAIIEIPSGTNEKWEIDKNSGQITRDSIDNTPRTINYLGYPGNYGFIPQTLLSKDNGGDGDPLDIIVLGPSVERGTVLECKVIGVLGMLDREENDDKLIGISVESMMFDKVDDIPGMHENYPGALEIVELWFTNYKGAGKMESKGIMNADTAHKILERSILEFKSLK